MAELFALWLPIVVSTVAVFAWGTLSWMFLGLHKKDIRSLAPDAEAALGRLIHDHGIAPDCYMFPMVANQKDMKSEAFLKRFAAGPWGALSVWPSQPNFARNLGLTTLFYFVVSVLVGYIASQARPAGAGFLSVFQIAATVAIMGYALGGVPNGIFFGKKGSAWLSDAIDALVQGLATGLVFALLWPGAMGPGAMGPGATA